VGSGKAASKSKSGDIEVLDEDVAGLDVDSAANESEASKRKAVADALKDLIAMGSDDDEDEDGEDDEEDEAAMQAVLDGMGSGSGSDDDDMDGRMPAKGSLQVKPKSALKAAGKVAPAAATAAKPSLSFAPSAPSRSAADIVAAARAAIAAKAAAAPAAAAADAGEDGAAAPVKVKATKLDKRAARHERLMSRLALPGTAAMTAKRSAKGISAGAFHSLNLLGAELATSVLTPTQQNAIAKLQARGGMGAAGEKRDVLFLSEEGDRERMKQLQAQIQRVKQQTTVAAPRVPQTAAPAPNSAAAALAAAPAAAAPVQPAAPTPSPFIPTKNLSKQARKRQHANELAHFTAVLHHSSFQSSPLAALHTHLTNTTALQKLQQEAAGLSVPAPAQQKKSMSGSAKKKNKKAQDRRQQILQQANQ
jgi:hypothetical protein